MVSANFLIQVKNSASKSLNPYYAGRWFLLAAKQVVEGQVIAVLIFIMLEGGFCCIILMMNKKNTQSLNPYYAGRWFLLLQTG